MIKYYRDRCCRDKYNLIRNKQQICVANSNDECDINLFKHKYDIWFLETQEFYSCICMNAIK